MTDRAAAARALLAGMPGRAVDAAKIVAGRLGIDASDAYPMRLSFSAQVHLAPSPAVARVAVLTPLLRDRNELWFGREVAVAAALADRGVPVVRPLDREVHRVGGLDVTVWEYAEHSPGAVPDPPLLGSLLADLHAALRELPVELADQRLPALDDLVMSGVPVSEVAAIEAALPPRPVQVLHGDANARNLLMTPAGWIWHDFEETCLGPVEWDLAVVARSRVVDGRAALASYPDAPSYQDLQPWIDLRTRQVALWDDLAALLP